MMSPAGRAAAEGGGAGMASRPVGTAGRSAVDAPSTRAGAGEGAGAGGAGSSATMEAAGAPAIAGTGDNAGGGPAPVTCPAMTLATGRTTETLQVDGVAR